LTIPTPFVDGSIQFFLDNYRYCFSQREAAGKFISPFFMAGDTGNIRHQKSIDHGARKNNRV